MLASRTASRPLPRTSPMIMRTPYGRVQRLVQVAADVGRRAGRDVPAGDRERARPAARAGAAPPAGPPRPAWTARRSARPAAAGPHATAAAIPVASAIADDVDRGDQRHRPARPARSRRPISGRQRRPPRAPPARTRTRRPGTARPPAARRSAPAGRPPASTADTIASSTRAAPRPARDPGLSGRRPDWRIAWVRGTACLIT